MTTMNDHHLHGGDACTEDPATGACTVCMVNLASDCATCGGRGYHRKGCSDPECEEPARSGGGPGIGGYCAAEPACMGPATHGDYCAIHAREGG